MAEAPKAKWTPKVVKHPGSEKKATDAIRIACISDTHGKIIPEQWVHPADILLCAGDLTNYGQQDQVEMFVQWALQFPCQHRVIIAGNHDLTLDPKNYDHFNIHPKNSNLEEIRAALNTPGITYLEHQSVTIDGLKIFGSPYSPEFCDWAFPILLKDCPTFWDDLSDDIDIMVTHGPPYGVLDECYDGALAGCPGLLKTIDRIQPALHVFGHIHEVYGTLMHGPTLCVNASVVNLQYKMSNHPVYVDLNPAK